MIYMNGERKMRIKFDYHFGYRDTIIEKVIYNGEKDFAEELKRIESLPIDELLDYIEGK